MPPELRQALNGFDAAKDSLVIPMSEIEPRMRSGRLRFRWSELNGWCSAKAAGAVPPDLELDLPLAPIIPLFLAARRSPDGRRTVQVDSGIPDIFGKARAPEPAAAPPEPAAAAPIPTPSMPAEPPTPPPAGFRLETAAPLPGAIPAPAPSPSAEPDGPEQIIQKIRALDGVSGAFLATADGLLITGAVANANDNLLAAFAPTVFTQVAKYSGMAHLSPLEAVDLHLEDSTIQIRKAGRLFMGVVVPRGHAIPVAELERISASIQRYQS
jgi:predicted regulator of Ras-like GTPase activity (Roadblock/LC7/MglB family)